MLLGFSISSTSEEDGVGTGGVLENELVEGHDSTSSGDDSSSGSLGNLEGADSHLGDSQESDIVSDSSNENGGSVFLSGEESSESRDRDGSSVDSRVLESLEDGLSESSLGSSGEEREELKCYIVCLTLMRRC